VNKDKRAVVQVVADLVGAYTKERSVPSKVLIILRDSVKELALSEERSLKRMEPFKDSPNTAANYDRGYECWQDLLAAQEALEEDELDEAWPLLVRVALDPSTQAEPVQATPTKRRSRRKL
jgi:hypothetical protein